MSAEQNKALFILAEFDNPAVLLEAARKIHDSGYSKFDCHSPFPIHGMDEAMKLKRSPLGVIVAVLSLFVMTGGLLLQWWTNAVDYPLVISGKPFVSYQAYAPVGFGITIFCAGLAAFVGMLILNKLPQIFHPLFYSDRFNKVTDDGFFVSIEGSDTQFDPEKTKAFLESINGNNVEVIRSE